MRRTAVILGFCVLGSLAQPHKVQWDYPNDREVNLVTLARIKAEREIQETRKTNDANYIPRPAECPCAFDVFNIVQNRELPPTRKIIGPAILKIDTLSNLKELTGLSVDTLTNDPLWIRAWEKVFPCQYPISPKCDPNARYRTFDGSCNNLRNPLLGTPFQPQSRFLAPEYVGDVELPRTRSLENERLPRVRPTSNIMNSDKRGTCLDEETVAVLSWGILVTIDTKETPTTSTDHRGRPFTCCRPSAPRRECFDIGVADDDPFFNVTCLPFVRASPTLADPCRPGRRQQINQVNAFFDASFVYGLSKADNDQIRTFKGERKASLDEVITQTALFRLHNKYATRLSKINRHWTDEKLFQETRRIIGAVVQKITYDEYLTTFLNDATLEKYCLKSKCSMYDDKEDPQIRVGYSATAGQFGHSRIPNLPRFFSGIRRITQKPTSPDLLNQLVDDMLHEKAACIDRFFEDIVRNKLFKDEKGNSYDLMAVTLERARDTALPPYNRWREYCGLPQAQIFTTGPGGLVDHTEENVKILQQAYEKTEFIDLFTGGLSEKNLPGARVGPTFSCILAKQFQISKVADRYFWNRNSKTGFSHGQRRLIDRITFAKVICDTYGRRKIQRDAFRIQSKRNSLVFCRDLPDINLNLWREKRRRY